MADKRIERWYLTQLRSCLADFPPGLQRDGESPDFIIWHGARATGIELTVFHLPPAAGQRPHQELQTLKDRVVTIGSRLHANAGGPGLYVSVFFNNPTRLSKGNAAEIGQALSAAVLRSKVPKSLDEEALRVPWDELPDCIGDITIRASVDGRDRLWSADAGGWVTPVQPDHIQAVVTRKEDMLAVARTKCTDVWLVIVNDDFGKAAPAELSELATHFQYSHRFDRLL
jgi:hypothetical protein